MNNSRVSVKSPIFEVMKPLLSLFLIIYLLSNSGFTAQNIDRMNKSNLKEHIQGLSTKIDSLKDVNYMLEESKDSLLLNVSLLVSTNDMNEIEISRLNNLVLTNNQEIERLQSDLDIKIATLDETILNYQDSIVQLQESVFKSTGFNCTTSRVCFKLSGFNCTASRVCFKSSEFNCTTSRICF